MHEIKLPQLGQTVEEATITQWLKKEGDTVAVGDVLFTVQTDKAEIECESTATGTLRKILVGEGEEAPVLTVVALVGEANEALPEGVPAASAPVKQEAAAAASAPSAQAAPAPVAHALVASVAAGISPRAKKVAEARGLDTAAIAGTGPNGRVIEADVLAALAAHPAAIGHQPNAAALASLQTLRPGGPTARRLAREAGVDLNAWSPAPAEASSSKQSMASMASMSSTKKPGRYPLTPMRRIIATRMAESKFNAPHFYVTVEVDMKAAAAFRAQAQGFKPSFNDLIVQAVAKALRAWPQVNARWLGDAVEVVQEVNIGVAVALEDGLIVPVVRNADTLTLQEISEAAKKLAEKARTNKLLPDDYSGSTFTISNLGAFGVDHFTAIINQPDSAILAVGRIADQVVAIDGGIQIRPRMKMTLSSDHRVIDGAVAAQFMAKVKALLEAADFA